MSEDESESKSNTAAITAGLIVASTVLLLGGILIPPYLRDRASRQLIAERTALAMPVLDAIVAGEAKIKETQGKFWRDKSQEISAEGAKALGVELSAAPGFRFAIAPPDLDADPTLRIEAKTGDPGSEFVLKCVYDSISKSKNCKGPGDEKQ